MAITRDVFFKELEKMVEGMDDIDANAVYAVAYHQIVKRETQEQAYAAGDSYLTQHGRKPVF
jgi:hypothetical protein